MKTTTQRMTQIVRFKDSYAVMFDGQLATARWNSRGPAEAQLNLLRQGHSIILPDDTIKHTPQHEDAEDGCCFCDCCALPVPVPDKVAVATQCP